MLAGPLTSASSFIRPWQVGQASTSTAKVRARSSAVGKRVKIGRFDSTDPWLTVVGVHKDVRHSGLAEDVYPSFLRPYSQAGWPFVSIVVRTTSAPASFVNPVKKALAQIEPNQPVVALRSE